MAGITITSATRDPANGAWIRVTYTVDSALSVASFHLQTTGNPSQATQITSGLNGEYTVTTWAGAALDPRTSYKLFMRGRTAGSEPQNVESNTVTVPAWTVASPTLVAVTRMSPTRARATFSGATVGGRLYVKRRVTPAGADFVQVNAMNVTSASGYIDFTVPDSMGTAEAHITVGQFGVESKPSTARAIEPWWELPLAPGGFTANRNATSGVTTLSWTASSTGPRDAWKGYHIWRWKRGETRPLRPWRTVTRNLGTMFYIDSTGELDTAYEYATRSFNAAGESSTSPSADVDAVRDVPNSATSVSLTHLEGNRYRVDWSISATTQRPITSQKVLGRRPGTTATKTLATVTGSVTTATLDLPDNLIYEVAVLTSNGVGSAGATSSWEGLLVTAPSRPASLSALWTTPTQVTMSWPEVSPASIGDLLEVRFSTEQVPDRDDDAQWDPLPSVSNWATNRSTIHPSASTVLPHTYRVRTVHSDSGLASDWVYSPLLPGQAVPDPPTMLMPGRIDATGTVPLAMVPNPVDNTAQTAGQIRYRRQGLTSFTTRSLGSASSYTIAANTYTNNDFLEVQGRTAGATGVYGDWSPILLVPLRAAPTATILSPAPGVFTAQTMTMTWEASDQASAWLELWDDTGGDLQLLETAAVGPDVRSHTWEAVLPDGREIITQLQVRDAWQAASPQSVTVTVEYDLPAPPSLSAEVILDAAQVLLQATPRNALQTVRTNLAPSLSSMLYTPPLPATLSDGTEVGIIPPGFTPKIFVPTGSMYQYISLEAAWPLPWSGLNRGLSLFWDGLGPMLLMGSDGAVLPELTRHEHLYTDASRAGWGWELRSEGGDAHVTRPMVMQWDDVADEPTDKTYFDGDTQRVGYVYGWDSDGSAWEAVPATSGDRAVAPTVRIEIWCSESGEPGSYTRCGETDGSWNFHDEHPFIGVPIWYVARSYGDSGAWAESDPVVVTVESKDVFVHYGPGLYVKGRRTPLDLVLYGGGLDAEAFRYEGHAYYTRHSTDVPVAQSMDVDVTLLPHLGASSLTEWTQAMRAEEILYREPGGLVMRGFPDLTMRTPAHAAMQRIAFSVSESGAW